MIADYDLPRTAPEDVTSPGDNDFLKILAVNTEVMLREARKLFFGMLTKRA